MLMNISWKKIVSTLVLIIISSSIFLYAYVTGITGETRKTGGYGCSCHNYSPSSNVNVEIVGPDTLSINETANYSVTITGGPLKKAGVDIAASTGTLSPLNSNLRKDPNNGELTHSLPKSPSNGKVTFSFSYKAPGNSQTITLYSVGNSVNNNGINDSGDEWNFSPNKKVVVLNSTGVEDNIVSKNFALDQNYPNPFNPSTIIKYSLAKTSHVTLKIYNILGKEVAQLVNGMQSAGVHQVKFQAQTSGISLAGGIYLYRLKAGSYTKTMKMLLLK